MTLADHHLLESFWLTIPDGFTGCYGDTRAFGYHRHEIHEVVDAYWEPGGIFGGVSNCILTRTRTGWPCLSLLGTQRINREMEWKWMHAEDFDYVYDYFWAMRIRGTDDYGDPAAPKPLPLQPLPLGFIFNTLF